MLLFCALVRPPFGGLMLLGILRLLTSLQLKPKIERPKDLAQTFKEVQPQLDFE